MSETAYQILARVLRDNDAEVGRIMGQRDATPEGFAYRDGLNAASDRVRAAMASLPRPAATDGGPDNGGIGSKASPRDGGGNIIEADYTIVGPGTQKVSVRFYPS